jgi:squalene synthase HpnC
LRPAAAAIYAFARSADDLADEGDASAVQRLAALAVYEQGLDAIEQRRLSSVSAVPQLFIALEQTMHAYQLPLQPLRDLLSAFRQDVVTTRYPTFAALEDYCRRSANPVGIVMLHLYGSANAANLRDSDAICTALQLINFWQDAAIDWQKGRIYLPQEDMDRFGVTEEHLATAQVDARWCALMRFEVARARALMLSGAPLATRLPGRIGWELRLVVQGGLRILEAIEAAGFDVFRQRPVLRKADWCRIVWRALWMKSA